MPDLTPDDVRKAAVQDYGQFVAKNVIYVGNARAYNPGDAVPASEVGRSVSEDDVVGVKTKTGKSLTETES